MSLITEFKEFAMKGNVVDMAVGVIIGGAFGKIVTSFVGDVVMPLIGTLVGGVNFTDLAVVLKAAQGDVPAVLLKYGAFLQTIFDFLIIAIAIFIAIKMMNKLKRAKEKAPEIAPPPSTEAVLLSEIRDLLKRK